MKKLVKKENVSGSWFSFSGIAFYTNSPKEIEIGPYKLEVRSVCDSTAHDIFNMCGLREPALDQYPVPVQQELLEKAIDLAFKSGQKYSGDPDFCGHWFNYELGDRKLPFIMADEYPEDTNHAQDAFGVMLRRQYNEAVNGKKLMARETIYFDTDQMLEYAYVPEEERFDPALIKWSDHAYCNDRPELEELGLIVVIEPDLSMSVKLRGRDY